MAQRTVHYLFGELLAQHVSLRDKNRFLLGNLLPDAYGDRSHRDITHFTSPADTPDQVYFDFNRFRQCYDHLIQTDDLYLGYYMHLATDCFYRKFNRDMGLRMPTTRQEVGLLHQDYHILNAHIVKGYGLHNTITAPIDFGSEPICRLAPFRLDGFLRELDEDFREETTGRTHFITGELLDAFIAQCLPLGEAELSRVMKGEHFLRSRDFATRRNV